MNGTDIDLDSLRTDIVRFSGVFDIDDSVRCTDDVRAACEQNSCGFYGRNCMCPPKIPSVKICSDTVHGYSKVLVFKTVFPLEHQFDLDGMMAGNAKHQEIVRNVRDEFRRKIDPDAFTLSAGACLYCKKCACEDGEECRFPDKSIPSLEAYCIDLVGFAKRYGIRYGSGDEEVGFFGMILFGRRTCE